MGNNNKEQQQQSAKEKIVVGIVRPISIKEPYKQGHWGYIHRAIEEALLGDELYEFEVNLVSENTKSDIIQSTIIKNLYHADVIVCDLSSLNPNVFFELGIRMAYRKPCVLLIDDKTSPPFDVAPIRYIDYPSSFHRYELEEKQREIRETVIQVYNLYKEREQVAYSPFFTEVNIKDSATLEQKDVTAIEALSKKLDLFIAQQENKQEEPSDRYYSLFSRQRAREAIKELIISFFDTLDESYSRDLFIERAVDIAKQYLDRKGLPPNVKSEIMDDCLQKYIYPYSLRFKK